MLVRKRHPVCELYAPAFPHICLALSMGLKEAMCATPFKRGPVSSYCTPPNATMVTALYGHTKSICTTELEALQCSGTRNNKKKDNKKPKKQASNEALAIRLNLITIVGKKLLSGTPWPIAGHLMWMDANVRAGYG